jgi:hypothetical protein
MNTRTAHPSPDLVVIEADCPVLITPPTRSRVEREVTAELERARAKHGDFNSGHEGYAVILEELDELWDEVKAQHQDLEKARKEAIQVAASAMRFVEDVCDRDPRSFSGKPVPKQPSPYSAGRDPLALMRYSGGL